MTVVGVAPEGFNGTIGGLLTDLWVPAAAYRLPPPAGDSVVSAAPRDVLLTIFGRLRPGLSRERARAMLRLLAPHLSTGATPPEIRDVQLDAMTSIPAMARGDIAEFMAILSATAGLVLLIAATNVAGMLLARAMYRRREIAVRLALGASRGRVVRQMLTESGILCIAGGAAGVLLADWMIGVIPAVQPPIPVRAVLDLRLEPRVLVIALGIAMAASLIAGLVPALQTTARNLGTALHGGADAQTRSRRRLRTVFVVTQLAMSLALLVTAGLFVRALQRGLAVDPGFDPAGMVEAGVDLAPHGYNATRASVFYARLLDHLRARPEIASATIARWTPLSGSYNGAGVTLPGESADGSRGTDFLFAIVDAGYFETMRVPIMAGRAFTAADEVAGRAFAAADAPDGVPAVVVNEEFARRLWPTESPVGRTLRLLGHTVRVVGVARDGGKGRGLNDDGHAWAYLPAARQWLTTTIYVRARSDPAAALTAIRHEVSALDPNIALVQPRTVSSQLDVYLLPQRLAAGFIGAFGMVGLALAAIGLYGMLAFHVAQRTRELGIRMALGARKGDVVRDVLRQAARMVIAGVAAGLVLAVAIGHLARAFLFGIGAADPLTLVAVPMLLGGVALLASYIPARRAAAVDPMESLRAE
jgi:predicted permease